MRDWLLNYRDVYLRALLRGEGRGETNDEGLCGRCTGTTPGHASLRCRDCHGGELLCVECCVILHRANPLHVVEEWTGVYFRKTSLKQIGLRVQFGHMPGETCARPVAGSTEFVVLHDNGIHEVAVDFCRCKHRKIPWYLQLLHGGWYPATTDQPQTCATFACLDLYRSLSVVAKTSAYDFYALLEKMTDETGVKPPRRYQVFLRMARQWRHLGLLLFSGRGHDPTGVFGTASGELAIRCPACPRPGVNLPDGWENAPKEDQCLYILFIALDACFRLKRRAVSSELKDPGLGTGWAYMVEWGPYREYLIGVTDQTEISTCTGLAALDYANTKFSRGYSTTGVGMGVCARHVFVLPNGVGDLQAGERYANMDYILGSLLRHFHRLLRKIISYDIVCQWCKELKDRLSKLPPLVRCNILLAYFRFVIPKLHIKGHKVLCWLLFSLCLVPGSGQTDAEGIERCWASIGGAAASTKVCGPGARADQLDDHWHHWNWTKLINLPTLLRRRLDNAKAELKQQETAFEAFTVEQADRVPAWKAMVDAFEEDGSKNKNPYEVEVEGMTENEVRNALEEAEEREAAAGRPVLHEVGPAAFLVMGLEIEDEQRRIRIQGDLQRTSTAASKINLRSSRRKLDRSIERFRGLQATYSPGALVHLAQLKVRSGTLAENVPLLLPSSLPPARRDQGGCVKGLVEAESALRDAQCRGTLVHLRRHLNVKARFLIYKKYHSRHQKMNTRSRTLIARNESKIGHESEKYQAARRALCALAEGGEAAVRWPRLRKEDIRCMDDAVQLSRRKEKERRAKVGESRREISWIWTLAGTAGVNEEELADALRIEWSKAYARTRRWREEVRTLGEEQRRFPESLKHEAQVWVDRACSVPVADGSITAAEAEGMLAYAMARSDMYTALAMRVEVTRTEPKLRRGQRRPREAVRVVSSWPSEAGQDEDVEGDEDDEALSDEEDLEAIRIMDGDEEDM
ncbi:hypothetical protein GGX14DRAFT_356364 [Mycena pura]|uniref:CxC2-like cysteine cluster KDZ transposase-associated domain-containing protein n=1 Tax=Mycena pura TaxID=153505 RepID=A0AAD6VPW3_9AGAR|nr:hypothetical protein GGX14DRAFT_356364 [Mycena pura]